MLSLFLSSFSLALRSVWRNRLRAALTVVGILIGVMSVVLVAALGKGARTAVGEQIASLGSNVIIVFPQSANASGARTAQGSGARLTLEDGHAIAREAPAIATWAPANFAAVQMAVDGNNASTTAVGTLRSYFAVRDWAFAHGGPWDESAERTKERVCVLGMTSKLALFGSDDAVGRTVRIGKHPFRVTGVLESKGQNSFGRDQDDLVLVPTGTFRGRINNERGGAVNVLLLSGTDADASVRAAKQIDAILRQRHRIGPNDEPDFQVRTQAEFQAMMQGIYDAMTVLLLGVAAVSLVVGGIGVMNIMLVSVTERTREIGIRMAIGAREANVLLQFLVEAVVLSLLGGVAGVAAAFGAAVVLARALSVPMSIDPYAIAVAFGTSVAIGVVFGFVPARRAARLDPVQALGRE
ncbi:MAG TPA: ABC transporter permease [Polyangiaceae bacterium]|nr:ABC transporter permease [Polyangiaceae bacterium]